MLDRRMRLLIIGGLAILALGASLWVSPPQTPIIVDDLLESPSNHVGETVIVRGTVESGSLNLDSSTFDLSGEQDSLSVDFSTVSVSNAFSEGKTVLVEGDLVPSDDGWLLLAAQITVGCPSKYDAT